MIRSWFHSLVSYLKFPLAEYAVREIEDLQSEIAFHIESSVEEKLHSGMTHRQSQRAALDEFGDVVGIASQCGHASIASHVFWHRVHQCSTVLLVVIVGALVWYTFSMRSAVVQGTGVTASGYSFTETTGDVTGSVISENGGPVDAAHVLAVVKTWPANGFRQQSYMTRTTRDGSFSIKDVYAPDHDYEVQIAVIADGRLLQSEYFEDSHGLLDPIEFQMQKTTPFAVRFESSGGEPVVGVDAFPFERIDEQGNRHSVYFCSADPIVNQSGPGGEISMPHFLPGDQATIFVRFPDQEWETRELTVPDGKELIVVHPNAGKHSHGG